MSLIEHLEALRRALIISLIAWSAATIAAIFVAGKVITFLITRAGIGDHREVLLGDVELGIVSAILHSIDHHLLEAGLKTLQEIVQEVMQYRARRRGTIDLPKDGHTFPDTNKNRQDTFALFFYKRHHCCPFRLIKEHRANGHLLQGTLLLMPRRCTNGSPLW